MRIEELSGFGYTEAQKSKNIKYANDMVAYLRGKYIPQLAKKIVGKPYSFPERPSLPGSLAFKLDKIIKYLDAYADYLMGKGYVEESSEYKSEIDLLNKAIEYEKSGKPIEEEKEERREPEKKIEFKPAPLVEQPKKSKLPYIIGGILALAVGFVILRRK